MMTVTAHPTTSRHAATPASAMNATAMNAAAMNKIVVLGATSGIALEVQRLLAHRGCELLLVARSSERLAELQADLAIRGAQQVLTYWADLASIQQHAAIFEFVRRNFLDFDTVLLAYGSMHDQKESEGSVDILLEELRVNFVSATAILTLFAADLERRRTGCVAAVTSRRRSRAPLQLRLRLRQRRAFPLPPGAPEPPSSRRRPCHHHQARTGADSHDRSLAQLRTLCRPREGCPGHRTRPRTPVP